ncbi:hypothetical protein NH8B_3591 [Pseudogulbenkiania sp. NH8B]|uniref:hypothetical protein n=1 Tax=Pseudogulbenkiania sp. (strain NH8B) TaxID=748280 RepID=UPI000227A620|nr:hypothetical protein [Pseudogulbenkiania sp. NH8B]BAK78340.1 hypothetical protein NH8B_3591 [Pseudogulbenkiania sp. NH8B]
MSSIESIAASAASLYAMPAVRKAVNDGLKEVGSEVESVGNAIGSGLSSLGSAISSGVGSVVDEFTTLGKTIDTYI